MAKPYKLMKADEGYYNIRDSVTDEITGTIQHMDGMDSNWHVNILGYDAELASKDKAVGFVRGVYAAKNGSGTSPVSSAVSLGITEVVEDVSVLLATLKNLKTDLGA